MKKALLVSALLIVLLWFSGCIVPIGLTSKEAISIVAPATIVPREITTAQVVTIAPVTTV